MRVKSLYEKEGIHLMPRVVSLNTEFQGYFLVDDYFTVFFDALGSLYPNGVKELC